MRFGDTWFYTGGSMVITEDTVEQAIDITASDLARVRCHGGDPKVIEFLRCEMAMFQKLKTSTKGKQL
jgi:hypothetical protein